jgi:glutaredoxin
MLLAISTFFACCPAANPAPAPSPPLYAARSFCIEVSRTLVELGVPFTYYRIDLFNAGDITGPRVHAELRRLTGQRTLPYVYVGAALVGGCDDTKALVASGEFDRLLGATNGGAAAGADLENGAPAGAGGGAPAAAGVDEGAPRVVGALLEFPNTVDGRVVRAGAAQAFVVAVLLAALAYQEKAQWRWVAVGLLADFCLRFYVRPAMRVPPRPRPAPRCGVRLCCRGITDSSSAVLPLHGVRAGRRGRVAAGRGGDVGGGGLGPGGAAPAGARHGPRLGRGRAQAVCGGGGRRVFRRHRGPAVYAGVAGGGRVRRGAGLLRRARGLCQFLRRVLGVWARHSAWHRPRHDLHDPHQHSAR